ncbi:MAG: ATP-binding protein [Alphaproteobacteria bacterium]
MVRRFSPKHLVPRGLFARSVLLVVVPLVVLQIVVAVVFFEIHIDKVSERLAESIAGEVAALVDLYTRAEDDAGRAAALGLARHRLDLEPTFVPGATLAERTRVSFAGIVHHALSVELTERLGRPFRVDARNLPRDVAIAVQLDDGVLDVIVRRERLFSGTAYVTLMWMVATSVLLTGLAVHFIRKQVRPLRRLAAAAESFGMGRTDVELVPRGAREVRRAARAFLAMRERIQRQVSQRTQMLAGVSHDLRTPLTRMKLELALLARSEEVEALEAEVRAMERMVEEYLAFARGEETESPVPTDLALLVRDVADRATSAGRTIKVSCRGDLIVEVRADAMRRALDNLIDNALRHGARVAVAAARKAGAIEITVDDDGPGIPAAAREDAFKPFQRLDEARNMDKGGVGLGLTIARDAVRRHGGDIALLDSPLGGLRARVRLPV